MYRQCIARHTERVLESKDKQNAFDCFQSIKLCENAYENVNVV